MSDTNTDPFYSLKQQRTARDFASVQRQSTAVTPSPSFKPSTQGNHFNALSQDTDDEESNRSNNNSNQTSDISAASSIDSDYIDIFEDNMNNTPTDTVLEGLACNVSTLSY